VNEVIKEEEKANCFAFGRDENGFPLKGKSVARRGIPPSPHTGTSDSARVAFPFMSAGYDRF
jgi:hypothetical protein